MNAGEINPITLPVPPNQYRADLDGARSQLRNAAPDQRLDRFETIAREYVRWITLRDMSQTTVFNDLMKAAIEVGIAEEEAHDILQAALARSEGEVRRSGSRSIVGGWRARCITADALRDRQFAPIAFVVRDLIPEGVTLLAGKPKIGKSWFGLDLSVAVASGRSCLSDASEAAEGDVLYAALEDNPRRLQRRMNKLMGNEPWPRQLTLATEWRRLDEGGVDDFRAWTASVATPRLVVIDTLAAIRPRRQNLGYREDYESLAELQRLAGDRGLAVVVLHHLRKMAADDPFDTVSGTLGLTGSADTILVLARKGGGATLHGRGRDIEEIESTMEFNPETCRWRMLGPADEERRSEQREAILAAIGDAQLSVPEIMAATSMPRGNVDRLLYSMRQDGEVERVERGIYRRNGKPG
jgi:hypothetical protein